MNYEKAYKESFEAAKGLHDAGNALTKKQMEIVFPQLAESEDERIRKELVNFLQSPFIKENLTDEKVAPWLAYLEKQKEQKPNLSDGEIEDKKRDIIAAIRNFYSTDYAKYLTSFLKGLSPEDNSEDEYGQEMLGIAYKLMYEHIPENLKTQEFWDSLKFMREYTGRVAIIHSYQHPAEWSEEDEDMLNSCISSIEEAKENRYAYKETDGDTSYDHEIVWLKSLRNRVSKESLQPHWKPSEEQMKWLKDVIETVPMTCRQQVPLESLYNDLKKL